ncbi:MAG: SLATT domain-containing protein [Thermoanaerobaculia bacterium]
MDISPQLQYVKQQVDYEIGLYTQRKHFNRRAALGFTVVPATLAALATVSIGASEKLGNQWLPIVAMIATGIASVLGAWESLFSNRKLWRVNNVALTELYELKSDIEYREKAVDRLITQEETDQYFNRLRTIRKEGEQAYQRAVGQ